jgi:hypothetical protein
VLTVDPRPQIPRRQTGITLRRGLSFRDGLRLDLHTPGSGGPHPLVVYVPGGGFVVAPRRMARRSRAFIAAAGYAVASVEYRTICFRAERGRRLAGRGRRGGCTAGADRGLGWLTSGECRHDDNQGK